MTEVAAMEFVVPHQKSHLVLEKVERIGHLFNVAVRFSSPPQSAKSSGVQWIMLQGHKESNEKAKEYINSLCDPEMDTVISFPDSVYNVLTSLSNKLEYDSGAVITFISNHQARIRGSQMAVVMASSAIEDLKTRPGESRAEISPTGIDAALKEFAMKLGYTEKDIEVVVKKHGPSVNENTLLHELIKISRTPSVPCVARGPSRVPATEPERTSYAVAKGLNHIPEQNRDVVARGAPSSCSTAKVHTVTVRGDRMSFEGAVSPTPKRETLEKAPLDKQEEQLVYQQLKEAARNGDSSSGLRHIVIDGSNVAMSHGNQEVFSCFGIALCVDWFKQRGHKDITVFVPQWRKEMPKPESPITDQEILSDLEKERIVVFTPSRRVNGRRIVCYDDRFIVRLAADTDGIIVSNDNYRDLINENPKWKEVIEQRLLMFSFVTDIFMVPDDPLGRHGPTLDDFLRKGTIAHPRICPYLRKCTFGLKCRFYHPERDPARKQEASKQPDVMSSKSVAQTSHDPRRTETTTERQTYRPEGAVYDIQGGRGVYNRQQHPVYPEYGQDMPRQRMPAVMGVRHHPYVDPYYAPIHQMSPYAFQQPPRLVHEQHGGSASVGPHASPAPEVIDAPWDKKKEELFEQLKGIYSNKEHEDIIRRVVQNSHGKDVLTLADIVAELIEK